LNLQMNLICKIFKDLYLFNAFKNQLDLSTLSCNIGLNKLSCILDE
jgi:hypothetical protein